MSRESKPTVRPPTQTARAAVIDMVTAGDAALVSVSGLVDERFLGFGDIGAMKTVVINVSGMTRMTSFGVRQWLKAMEVIGLVLEFGLIANQCRLGVGDVSLCFLDRGRSAIDIGCSAVSIRPSRCDRALLRCDCPGLVDDLALQRAQIRACSLQGIFVRTGIDLEEQSTLFDKCVVLHRERTDGAINLRSNADEIGEYLCVVGARIPGGLVYHP